ncbi:hypothetical protein ABPG75_013042 [Micractinium tetrahymenae]
MLPACTCLKPAAGSCSVGRPSLPLASLAPHQRRLGCAAPAGRPTVLRAVAAGAARVGTGAQTGITEDASRDFASSLALMVLGAALISERLYGEGIVAALELDHPHVEPLLWGIAGTLALAAGWPAKRRAESATALVRQLAGRLAFAGLCASLVTELVTGNGLLALLQIDTGAQLSEAEALLAALTMLVLTGPRKAR